VREPAARRRRQLIALGAVLLAGCTSSVLLDALIFFPDPRVPDPPPGVDERALVTDDGVRLHAWLAPAGPAAPMLVWSHGNGGNIASRAAIVLALRARGVGVLAYDYRGYGRSEGRPSEAGVYRDARAAYDAVRADGVAPGRIVCFGESLGAAVTVRLATERPCAGVVLVSPFTTLADVARRHYGPLGRLAGDRFDAVSCVRRLRTPLLVVHGDADEIVPFELGERLFAAAAEPKRFLRVAAAHHNDVFDGAGAVDAIAAFAREVAGGA
jgi:fermentation-respiration switch protein FrsA (DUF1100 family)